MMSFGPPGANPTMTRTGREGQDCAGAGALWSAIAHASSASRLHRFIVISLVRHDGVAADHRLPGGSFLFQVSGVERRRVEHRGQGLVLGLLRETRWFHTARDLGAPALPCRPRRARLR